MSVDKVVALLLAGGIGRRMGNDLPKQFLPLNGKPIIVHTLEAMEKCEDIDEIFVVCVESWQQRVSDYSKEYGISKFRGVTLGGETSMSSIANGIKFLQKSCDDQCIVVIHDSVRPNVPNEVLSDCIRTCRQYGNGCASLEINETVMTTDDGIKGIRSISRSTVRRVQTPQAYRLADLIEIYHKAETEGITDSVYTNVLASEMGYPIYFSKGSAANFKITNKEDIVVMEKILH